MMSDNQNPSTLYRRPLVEVLGNTCEECDATDGLEIHHLDGDRENNDIDNLELLCTDCHQREHYDTLTQIENSGDVDVETLAELIRQTTAARGVDLFAVKECGLSAADWARLTGRGRSSVSRNVRRGTDQLDQ